MFPIRLLFPALVLLMTCLAAAQTPSEAQLARWLKRFPEADTNRDGKLSLQEANAYRAKRSRSRSTFQVDPGWDAEEFPKHAVCYRSPEEIAKMYGSKIPSYPQPDDGSLRIVATGHSFMGPGFQTFPRIVQAAEFKAPPLVTHTGGGVTGSARYKWEQENGIFQFDRRPQPKLLAAISNANWDAMMWGPYYQDRPKFYSCWMGFCLKHNPKMKFFLSDAWPQLGQFEKRPKSEQEMSIDILQTLAREKHQVYDELVGKLNKSYPGKVFILPTCDAMVLAAEYYHRGNLPGVEGVHTLIGGKSRSIWRDEIGHLGPGFNLLEGYVFYATMYRRSPELIEKNIFNLSDKTFPSRELDRQFRKIAWQATIRHPLSGVTDSNQDGIGD